MNLILSFLLFLYNFKIFRRLVPSIIRKFYSKKKQQIKINNFQIILNVGSSIDREIFLKKIYDKDKFDYFENKINLHEFEAILGCKKLLKDSENLIFLQVEIIDRLETKVLDLLKSYNFKQINRIYPSDKRGGSDFYLINYKLLN